MFETLFFIGLGFVGVGLLFLGVLYLWHLNVLSRKRKTPNVGRTALAKTIWVARQFALSNLSLEEEKKICQILNLYVNYVHSIVDLRGTEPVKFQLLNAQFAFDRYGIAMTSNEKRWLNKKATSFLQHSGLPFKVLNKNVGLL